MSKSTKKLKKIDKQLYRMLNKSFGIKKYLYLGDMHEGYLTLVVTAKERKEA